MTRALAALLLAAAALAGLAGPAAADSGPLQTQKVHVLCVGGSNDPSAFQGVCAWLPLPV